MRLLLALLLLFLLPSCTAMVTKKVHEKTSIALGCSLDETKIGELRKDEWGNLSSWPADCRGRSFHCVRGDSGNEYDPLRAICEETAASKEVTTQKIVLDRLALETGCPAEKIKIDDKAGWSRGTETAYRMEACGKWYVCTTAAGRTDCKEALAQ